MLEYIRANREELLKAQRRAALCRICAYRTVSYDAVNILASMPPIDLLAKERTRLYVKRRRSAKEVELEDSRRRTNTEWSHRTRSATKGEWTRSLIRNLSAWVGRNHGEMNFHLTQLLSGHGCFSSYIHRIGKKETPACRHCNSVLDDAHHTNSLPCVGSWTKSWCKQWDHSTWQHLWRNAGGPRCLGSSFQVCNRDNEWKRMAGARRRIKLV